MKHYQSLWLALMWIVCGRTVVAEPAQNDGHTPYIIPIEYDALINFTPIVKVSVNGSEPLRFLLDTGVNESVLVTPTVARTLSLKPVETTPKVTTKVTQEGKTYNAVVINRLALLAKDQAVGLEFPQKSTVAYVLPPGGLVDSLTEDHIAGILGMKLLDQMSFCLDFSAQTLTFFPSNTMPPVSPQAVKLALLSLQEHQYGVSWSLGTQKFANGEIDTGAEITTIPEETARQAKLLKLGEDSTAHAYSIGSTSRYYLPHLQLGTESVSDLEVWGLKDKCLLGMNLLSRYRMTFDFSNRCLLLERTADYAQQIRPRGYLHLGVEKTAGHCVISDVSENPEAGEKGIQEGDRLLSVDGVPTNELPINAVGHLLEGYANTKATLVMERGSKRWTVSLLRKDAIDEGISKAINAAIRKGGVITLRYGGMIVIPASTTDKERTIPVAPGQPVTIPAGSGVMQNPKPR